MRVGDGERAAAPPDARPEISVIIAAYRAERGIAHTVRALREQSLDADRYEIVVVDDGSPDRTAERAREAGARVITQSNAGPAAARNRGVEAARGSIVVFTDADCEPAPDFLERLVEPILAGQARATKGAYWSRQREVVARLVQLEYESRYDRMEALQRRRGGIDFIDTYAAAFLREDFEAVGGFDTGFPGASVEDQELAFRLARRGVTMRFVPEARVWHRHADSWWGYGRKKAKIGFWKVAVLRRHPERAVHDSHTPQGLKLEVGLCGLLLGGIACAPVLVAAGAGSLALGWTGGALAGLGLAWLPFVRRVARADPSLLPWTPLFLWLRGTALGLGLVAGWLRGVRLERQAPALQLESEGRAP